MLWTPVRIWRPASGANISSAQKSRRPPRATRSTNQLLLLHMRLFLFLKKRNLNFGFLKQITIETFEKSKDRNFKFWKNRKRWNLKNLKYKTFPKPQILLWFINRWRRRYMSTPERLKSRAQAIFSKSRCALSAPLNRVWSRWFGRRSKECFLAKYYRKKCFCQNSSKLKFSKSSKNVKIQNHFLIEIVFRVYRQSGHDVNLQRQLSGDERLVF